MAYGKQLADAMLMPTIFHVPVLALSWPYHAGRGKSTLLREMCLRREKKGMGYIEVCSILYSLLFILFLWSNASAHCPAAEVAPV